MPASRASKASSSLPALVSALLMFLTATLAAGLSWASKLAVPLCRTEHLPRARGACAALGAGEHTLGGGRPPAGGESPRGRTGAGQASSTSTYRGPLGHGWHHSYDAALYVEKDVVLYRTPDGRVVSLPPLHEGQEHFDRTERLTLMRDVGGYGVRTAEQVLYRFRDVGRPKNEHVLSSISDLVGNAVRLGYDDRGLLVEMVDGAGRSFQLQYDREGRITAMTAPHPSQEGQRMFVVQYSYDGSDNLAQVIDVHGQPASYQYDRHLLVKETDRNGLSFYFQYDARDEHGRCIRTWGDGGIYDHKLRYDDDAGVTVVENSLGHKTAYTHRDGLVVKTVDALGAVTETEYDDHNEVVVETDALGQRTESKYDERGNLIEKKTPDGAKIELAYGPQDRPISAKDALGGEWTWKYDAYGRLLERVNPLGEKHGFEWQGQNLGAVIDPAGSRTILGYDAAGNLVTLMTPDGAESHWGYDGLGRVRTSTDPNGNQQHQERDAAGRVVRVQEADGNVRELGYDGEGNVVHAKDRQHDVVFSYQGMGRLASRSEAGTTVVFGYDAEEQLIAIQNEHGAVYRFVLDAVGNVSEEYGFDGLRRQYERDKAGRVAKVLRPAERHTSYGYDAAGRVVKVAHSDGSKEAYVYRRSGDLMRAANGTVAVAFERDALGRIVKETQGTEWVASEYDALGLRTSVKSSKGVFQTIRRTVMGDVLLVEATQGGPGTEGGAQAGPGMAPARKSGGGQASQPPSGSGGGASGTAGGSGPAEPSGFVAQFARDRLGLEVERSLPGGVHAKWHRDRLGRPVRQEVYRGNEFITGKQYFWDVNDRLKRVIDAMHGPVDYHHDALGNLAVAAYADGRVDLRMPDAVGNLFRTQDRGDRKYGPAGQLLEAQDARGTTRYEYDAEGNLTRKLEPDGGVWTYEWNGSGMLSKVVRPDGRTVEFAYDALGRRISKKYRDKTTRWVWDGNVPLHEWVERDPDYKDPIAAQKPAQTADAASIAAKSREAWLSAQPAQGPPGANDDGLDEALGTKEAPITWLFEPESFAPLGKLVGGERFGMVTDHLGTPTGMFDGAGREVWGAEIDTYGDLKNLRGARQTCPFRWPGQYEDAETGLYYNRFRYYDPHSGEYVSQDPIGLAGGPALYEYVHDPSNWMDPLGLQTCRGRKTHVFWSENKNPRVKAAAEDWARRNKATTLEMTGKGSLLQKHAGNLDWLEAQPAWKKSSKQFAKTATGEVHVFLPAHGASPTSIWETVEKPLLLANPNVTRIVPYIVP